MIGLLKPLKDFIKPADIVTDSVLFRLHSVFTAVLLMMCSLIITATEYVGKPIECIEAGSKKVADPINTFCWITATFAMPDAFQKKVGSEVAHPGVDNDFGRETAKKYYSYYQWVCIVLFFQGLCCFAPKFLWNSTEGGLINALTKDQGLGLYKKEQKKQKRKMLLDYLSKYSKRHNWYMIKYWMCEALCLINVVTQLYLMDKFFNGEFLSYGSRVLSFISEDQEERVDPMIYVFPKVTKCTFLKYGATGTIQNHDALCLLPLNAVNEKVYVFIWFWFMVLTALLVGLLVYRALIITVPYVRSRLLHAKNRTVSLSVAEAVSKNTDVGDWWILYMLGRTIDPLIYKEVLTELARKNEPKNYF